MSTEIKPLHAFGIILFFLILIMIYAWTNGKATDITGPDGLYKNNQQQLFIRINTDLLKFDASGNYLKTIDLKRMGIETVVGDILFTQHNHEIILRKGPNNRSVEQHLRDFLRLSNNTPIESNNDISGLFRCNLNTEVCTRFTSQAIDFNNVFHLESNNVNNSLYVADTSRHRLLTFNKQGEEVSEYDNGLYFPNHLKLKDNHLFVANTNKRVITKLSTDNLQLKFVKNIDIVPPTAKSNSETWPAVLQKVNNDWWIINTKNSMTHGGIYIFDENWQFKNRAATPANANPQEILQWRENEVLVADPTNFSLLKFNASGEILPAFIPKVLKVKLDKLKEQRQHYTNLSYLPMAVFAIFVLLGITIGIKQASGKKPNISINNDIKPNQSQSFEKIIWFSTDEKYTQKIQTLLRISSTLFLIILSIFIYAFTLELDTGDASFSTLSDGSSLTGIYITSSMIILMFSISLYFKTISKAKIGFFKNHLLLKDHQNKTSQAHISEIYYDSTTIIYKDIAVIYSNSMRSLFPEKDMQQLLYPLLKSANKTNAAVMAYRLYKAKHPQIYITGLYIVFIAVYIIIDV